MENIQANLVIRGFNIRGQLKCTKIQNSRNFNIVCDFIQRFLLKFPIFH